MRRRRRTVMWRGVRVLDMAYLFLFSSLFTYAHWSLFFSCQLRGMMNAHLAVHLQVVCMEIWTTPITRTRPCSAALVVAMLKQYQHCPVHTLHINGRDNLCDIDTYRHIHLTCWHTDVNYLCDPERSTSCAYFVVKGRVPTIPLKLHSLGPLNHTCPFCRSSQIFINIPLLPSRYHLFDFLVSIHAIRWSCGRGSAVWFFPIVRTPEYFFDQSRIAHF